jgi:hypothetical protein
MEVGMMPLASSRPDRRTEARLTGPAGGNLRGHRWPWVRRRDRRLLLYELSFAAGAHAPASARAAVRDVVRDRIDATAADDVELLVTELVTSRLEQRPAAPDEAVSLTVMLLPRVLHVELADPDRGLDAASLLASPVLDPRGGRRLLGALASRWGVRASPAGVWFELDRPRLGLRSHL